MAVKVVAELRAQFPELRLTMIGPDKGDGTRREVLRATRELGLEGCVDVRGPVPKTEIPRWLDLADIFINTSDIDNTPVTVLEAMACGLSVVSTNVRGIPCMLEDQVELKGLFAATDAAFFLPTPGSQRRACTGS